MTSPAPAIPSEEEIAIAMFSASVADSAVASALWHSPNVTEQCRIGFRESARPVMALFAPVLAEKEREIERQDEEIEHFAKLSFDDLGKNPPVAWRGRALAAEAALAAERERCAKIAERFRTAHFEACAASGSFSIDKAEMAQALCASDIAAAIRAQGE